MRAGQNIFALMAATVVFSLLGNEVEASKNKTNPVGSSGRILLGGAIAGTILIGISNMGDPGAELGQGLAIVAAATSVLVYGGPVWTLLGGLFGSTAPTSSTISTVPTTPTGG